MFYFQSYVEAEDGAGCQEGGGGGAHWGGEGGEQGLKQERKGQKQSKGGMQEPNMEAALKTSAEGAKYGTGHRV